MQLHLEFSPIMGPFFQLPLSEMPVIPFCGFLPLFSPSSSPSLNKIPLIWFYCRIWRERFQKSLQIIYFFNDSHSKNTHLVEGGWNYSFFLSLAMSCRSWTNVNEGRRTHLWCVKFSSHLERNGRTGHTSRRIKGSPLMERVSVRSCVIERVIFWN